MQILLYLILCAIVAVLGRNRVLGAWGFFLVAFFLTPILAVVILISGKTLRKKESHTI